MCRLASRDYHRQWQAANRDKTHTYGRRYYEAHRQKEADRYRRYRKANAAAVRAAIRRYRLEHQEERRAYVRRGWTPEGGFPASYAVAHRALGTERGPCAACGAPAVHWALDHEADLERLAVQVGGPDDGKVFSVAGDYLPKCSSCNHLDGYPLRLGLPKLLADLGQTSEALKSGFYSPDTGWQH